MEILLVLLLLVVLIGPSMYRFYESRKRPGQAKGQAKGPSYLRRMLGMLTPVFLLLLVLILLRLGLQYLGYWPQGTMG